VNFVSLFNQNIHLKQVPGGVLALSSRVGWKLPYGDDDDLPISERYFAGGSTTLRGFDLDEAGPRGGGQFMTIGNMEYRAPLSMLPSLFRRLSGALFYDTGTVFERPSDFSLSDFTHNAGAGLRYNTPLGPIRFDVGFNLNPRWITEPSGEVRREERVQYFFTLGHTF
jgi:outer membrane protein assembly factor BamA